MGEDKVVFSGLGFSYAIFFVITIVAQMILAFFLHWTGWANRQSDLVTLLLMTVPMYLCAFPVLLLLCKRIPAQIPANRESFHWRIWVGIVVVCIGVTFWCNLLGQGVMKLFDVIFQRTSNNKIQDLIMNMNPLVILIAAVVLAPIMEELIFRKLLIDRLYNYDEGIIILVSGLMFGFAHGNFFQFFYAFALGMIFAFIYVKTGKVIYTILLHMMINFMGSMIPIFLLRLSQSQYFYFSVLFMICYFVGIIIFMIASPVLLSFLIPRISLKQGAVSLPKEKRIGVIVINRGMLFFIIVGVILFFI